MTTLMLRLAGPMQAWGAASRFSRRETRHEPTKSGVLGLLAAAQGRRRTDELEDLAALKFGVRVDQSGVLIRDFQTARSLDGSKTMPLSYRFYLGDAVFLAGVEGNDALIEGLSESLANPTFPLYLGRRSCPPILPLHLTVTEDPLLKALQEAQWQAADWYRKKQGNVVRLRIAIDGEGAERGEAERGEMVCDRPVSFSPEHRRYEWRTVVEREVLIENPKALADIHNPMASFGGA